VAHLRVYLVTGVGWSFSEPVRQSLIPNVVPKAELANAIALNSAGFNLMKVVGPALGGVMIALFGAAGNFLVQGAAYVVVLLMIQSTDCSMLEPRQYHVLCSSSSQGRASARLLQRFVGLATLPVPADIGWFTRILNFTYVAPSIRL
jgi:MFS family permease